MSMFRMRLHEMGRVAAAALAVLVTLGSALASMSDGAKTQETLAAILRQAGVERPRVIVFAPFRTAYAAVAQVPQATPELAARVRAELAKGNVGSLRRMGLQGDDGRIVVVDVETPSGPSAEVSNQLQSALDAAQGSGSCMAWVEVARTERGERRFICLWVGPRGDRASAEALAKRVAGYDVDRGDVLQVVSP